MNPPMQMATVKKYLTVRGKKVRQGIVAQL